MKDSGAEMQQYNSANIFENRNILPWFSFMVKGSGSEIKKIEA